MSNPTTPVPDVKREWARLMARLRRRGIEHTCQYALRLIQTDPYPLTFGRRLVEYLLRRANRESADAAGRIIEALERKGVTHPLLDELHSSWLWCIGKRRAALSLAVRNAKRSQISYVVHHAGTLYRLMFKRTGSDYYRKKSLHYWRLAHILVKREEQEEAKQEANQRGQRVTLPDKPRRH